MRVVLFLAVFLPACGSAPERQGAAPAPAARVEPGEEPLETASMDDEEILPIEPEKLTAPAARRPCAWARAWKDPNAPKPLLAGVGGVPNPARVADTPLSLPVREPLPSGEIVVEIVINPDGSVAEAGVVRTTEPPWPDAEARILEAVRTWRYEASSFQGTPVVVCTTVSIRP